MEVNFTTENKEDIKFINDISENKNKILSTALSIGIKALSMTNVVMNGSSYYDPIKDIINNNMEDTNKDTKYIVSILEDLMNINQNSTKKGKLGEKLANNALLKKYPDWRIENISNTGHEGDCIAYSDKYGKILYEFKTYTSNVSKEEVIKFKKDVDSTNSLYGIFISQTSGIVNKNMIDIEIYNQKILIYISNSGLNGHGIELATELLIQLIDVNILDNSNNISFNSDNITSTIKNILFELSESINNYSRVCSQINESKIQMSKIFDNLYKKAFDYHLEGQMIISKIITEINETTIPNKIKKDHLNIYNNFLMLIDNRTNKLYFEKIYNLCNTYNIEFGYSEIKNTIFLIKNEKCIGKLLIKNKLELMINIEDKSKIQINGHYEKIKNEFIIIPLEKCEEIWNIIVNYFKK